MFQYPSDPRTDYETLAKIFPDPMPGLMMFPELRPDVQEKILDCFYFNMINMERMTQETYEWIGTFLRSALSEEISLQSEAIQTLWDKRYPKNDDLLSMKLRVAYWPHIVRGASHTEILSQFSANGGAVPARETSQLISMQDIAQEEDEMQSSIEVIEPPAAKRARR